MSLWSQMQKPQRDLFTEWTDERQSQLLQQIDASSTRALQYLTFTNGGSAVALATFMGTSSQVLHSPIAWFAQQCFLAGLIFAGLALAATYHTFAYIFDGLKADIVAVYGDKLDTVSFHARDNERANRAWIGTLIAYLSFAAFVVGAVAAAVRLPTAIGAGTSS